MKRIHIICILLAAAIAGLSACCDHMGMAGVTSIAMVAPQTAAVAETPPPAPVEMPVTEIPSPLQIPEPVELSGPNTGPVVVGAQPSVEVNAPPAVEANAPSVEVNAPPPETNTSSMNAVPSAGMETPSASVEVNTPPPAATSEPSVEVNPVAAAETSAPSVEVNPPPAAEAGQPSVEVNELPPETKPAPMAEAPPPKVEPPPAPALVLTDAVLPATDGPAHQTECASNGISRTVYHDVDGYDAMVTYVRADYFVVLADIDVRSLPGTKRYTGEVEIILPDQSRVYNVTEGGVPVPRRMNKQFDFMVSLAENALYQRYVACVPRYPTVYWRPKDLPVPPRVQVTPP